MSVKESAKEFLTLLEDKKYSYVDDLIETLIAQKDYPFEELAAYPHFKSLRNKEILTLLKRREFTDQVKEALNQILRKYKINR